MFKKQTTINDKVPVITIDHKTFINELNLVHKEEIIPQAIKQAQDDASKEQPPIKGSSKVHFEFIKTRYNRLILDFKTHSKINDQQYVANKDISQFKKLKKRLSEKLQTNRNSLRVKQRAFENLKSLKGKINLYHRSLVGITLLSASEAVFASSSFQLFVQNLLFSLIIGLTFAVALYYSAVISAKVLRKARNWWQFFGIILVIQLIIGTVFGSLGYLRIIYLEQMSEAGEIGNHLSVCQFISIQLFLFNCAILLKYFFLPSKQEMESYREWKQANTAISKLQSEQKQLDSSIKNLESGLDRTLITRRSLISSAADMELKIDSLYRDACSVYMKTNLHHRQSKDAIPESFRQPDELPKLTMFFQDPKLLEFNEAQLDDDK